VGVCLGKSKVKDGKSGRLSSAQCGESQLFKEQSFYTFREASKQIHQLCILLDPGCAL
jgi:hypothetical protein